MPPTTGVCANGLAPDGVTCAETPDSFWDVLFDPRVITLNVFASLVMYSIGHRNQPNRQSRRTRRR